jgi:hypothetical protein
MGRFLWRDRPVLIPGTDFADRVTPPFAVVSLPVNDLDDQFFAFLVNPQVSKLEGIAVPAVAPSDALLKCFQEYVGLVSPHASENRARRRQRATAAPIHAAATRRLEGPLPREIRCLSPTRQRRRSSERQRHGHPQPASPAAALRPYVDANALQRGLSPSRDPDPAPAATRGASRRTHTRSPRRRHTAQRAAQTPARQVAMQVATVARGAR